MRSLLLRRRAMMSVAIPIDTKGYVSNGLIMLLDGIDKGGASDRWKNLVGGSYFPYNEHSTAEANAVLFDGAGYLTELNAIVQAVEGCTIELCAEYINTTTYNFIYGSIYSASNNYADPASIAYIPSKGFSLGSQLHNGNNGLTFPNISAVTAPFTLSGTLTYGYLNGVGHSGQTREGWSTPAGLGGGTQGYNSNIRIFSLRIYNRELTSSEMLANQQNDNLRYNLGLTI